MTRSNRNLECPRCETQTLGVIGSDTTESNVGLRRYQCSECRRTFSTVEAFFHDEEGDEDCFLQLALNVRLRERENQSRRSGVRSRRQLKPIDHVVLIRSKGRVTLQYQRSPRVKSLFLTCRQGHPIAGDNVGVNSTSGNRFCITCRNDYQRDWWHRKGKHRRALARETAA